MRTKVAIVGAGPAGLMLGQLLSLMNISNVIVESRSRDYVEGRSRAGQITPATVKILTESGVGSRVHAQGMVHSALQFHYDGATRELDFQAMTGRTVTIYGQQEIIKDLIAARLKTEFPIMALRHRELPIYGVQFHPESVMTQQGLAMLGNYLQLVEAVRPARAAI
ncbi:P-hydroxybenzoate hydroxylase [Pseudomonas sp. R1-43-08]|uniref:FAD-dependent monooxygenase n=1 Tax=Pseudomonas sp. R1-43-08 TaxID=1173270 RepID=UPI000F57A0AD|nr:FAD-dependent monooxygenase [Pseudomonas sp. R1-43-08]AZF42700.1 P-hydroxybenzoate hydroxylase [Pseudomonas sp. R1-43-08]